MKKVVTIAFTAACTLIGSNAMALPRLEPNRCAHDSLSQWTQGQALPGTARGRNEWLKTCEPKIYRTVFPGGNEFDPNLPQRRAYPTYGVISGFDAANNPIFTSGGYIAPTTPVATQADPTCAVPERFDMVGLCTSGCVTPDSEIVAPEGNLEIGLMDQEARQDVSVPTLTDSGDLGLTDMKVKRYYKDMMTTTQPILVFTTKAGGTLKMSKNHPILNGNHEMVKAEDFKIGDSLITEKGEKDEIVSITEKKYNGRLYNFSVDTAKLEESLYVVQGFISGDKKYQDNDVSEFNRNILRNVAYKMITTK